MSALVVYLVCSPELPAFARAAVDGGADVIELGFPFSDPLADGPVIREASARALADGMTTGACLEVLAAARTAVDVPLVPMTYASLLEAYGYERFAADAKDAGAASLIVADLPIDLHPEVRRIQLVAPTTTSERLERAAGLTDGWLYLVSRTGTTGARDDVSDQLPSLVARAREVSDVPLYAGFGISSPDQAADVARLVDGVIVGSAAVARAEQGASALQEYVSSLRRAIDAVALGSPA